MVIMLDIFNRNSMDYIKISVFGHLLFRAVMIYFHKIKLLRKIALIMLVQSLSIVFVRLIISR